MEDKQQKTLQIDVWAIVWSVIWLGLIILVILRVFVFQQVSVFGDSMQTNYHEGEQLLMNRQIKEVKRGQVVAVYEDREVARDANFLTQWQAKFFLKRIIGLPGEQVEIVGSKVIIYNSQYPEGVILQENYIADTTKKNMDILGQYNPKTEVSDEYFVLGDNRTRSKDSRIVGTFADFQIFGTETLKFWPSTDARLFELPSYSLTPIDTATQTRLTEARTEYQNGLRK
jgi:signal peptidase I